MSRAQIRASQGLNDSSAQYSSLTINDLIGTTYNSRIKLINLPNTRIAASVIDSHALPISSSRGRGKKVSGCERFADREGANNAQC